jgi:hypothetical protein
VHYLSCTKYTAAVNPIQNALAWFMRLSFPIGGRRQVEGRPRKDLPACFTNELAHYTKKLNWAQQKNKTQKNINRKKKGFRAQH